MSEDMRYFNFIDMVDREEFRLFPDVFQSGGGIFPSIKDMQERDSQFFAAADSQCGCNQASQAAAVQ